MGDDSERLAIEVVELGATASLGHHQAGVLEHGEMLRDRLAGRTESVPHREQGAELEQGLTVPGSKLIEDEAPCLVVKSSEHIGHAPKDRQVSACLSKCPPRLSLHPGAAIVDWLR